MLHVPPSWKCSTSDAAIVTLDNSATSYICRIVSTRRDVDSNESPSFLLSYTADLAVSLETQRAQTLFSQDVRSVEIVSVIPTEFNETPLDGSRLNLRFRLPRSSGGTNASGAASVCPLRMRLCVPSVLYIATVITLEGKRWCHHGGQDQLYGALVGRYVAVGCRIATGMGMYTVASMELKSGYRGVALVSGCTRIKLNDSSRVGAVRKIEKSAANAVHNEDVTSVVRSRPPARLFGLDEAEQCIMDAVMAARAVASSAIPRSLSEENLFTYGTLLYGPRGCGMSSLIRQCARNCGAKVLEWSLSSSLASATTNTTTFGEGSTTSTAQQGTSKNTKEKPLPVVSQTFFVRLRDAHLLFPATEPAYSAMARRCLLVEVQSFAQQEQAGGRCAVVVVADAASLAEMDSSTADALFFRTVAVKLPQVETRAQLIASIRGGTPTEWEGAAQALVGMSCADVLRAASQPSFNGAFSPPFRPVRWDDIGGLADVKRRLREALILPRKHREAYARFGLTSPRGVLLYGPPGCAKTTLVRALCTEGEMSLVYLDSANLISAYVGESERQLRDAFSQAAQLSPCVVFFDEVEVLGAMRETAARGGSDDDHARLLSTLLIEMDGFSTNSDVCFVGATNAPHLLDSALLRPGRLDYLICVPLPTPSDRKDIFTTALRSADTQEIDFSELSELSEGFSGADISALCKDILLDELGRRVDDSTPLAQHDTIKLSHHRCVHLTKQFQRSQYDVKAMNEFHQRTTADDAATGTTGHATRC